MKSPRSLALPFQREQLGLLFQLLDFSFFLEHLLSLLDDTWASMVRCPFFSILFFFFFQDLFYFISEMSVWSREKSMGFSEWTFFFLTDIFIQKMKTHDKQLQLFALLVLVCGSNLHIQIHRLSHVEPPSELRWQTSLVNNIVGVRSVLTCSKQQSRRWVDESMPELCSYS